MINYQRDGIIRKLIKRYFIWISPIASDPTRDSIAGIDRIWLDKSPVWIEQLPKKIIQSKDEILAELQLKFADLKKALKNDKPSNQN